MLIHQHEGEFLAHMRSGLDFRSQSGVWEREGKIYTLNKKDFKRIPDLVVAGII